LLQGVVRIEQPSRLW